MASKWFFLIAALGGVTGCTVEEVSVDPKGDVKAPVLDETVSSENGEPIDAFYLAIEAERWNVMIENALGLVNDVRSRNFDNDDIARIERALDYGIRNLLDLRDEVCQDGLVDAETCYSLKIPDWAFAWEETPPSLAELQARSDWLGEAIQPFVSAKCRAEDGSLRTECMVE